MRQEKLIQTLNAGVSAFDTVCAGVESLCKENFTELLYEEEWKLVPGGRYVMNHHGTTMFAFTIGRNILDVVDDDGNQIPELPVRIAAAHTDYPCLRLKPNADFRAEGYAQVNVEVYGGPILNTWFDRPLGLAGRVVVRGENILTPRTMMYRSRKPLMIVPNLAIHMNRDVNKGVEINNQVDLMPIVDLLLGEGEEDKNYFLSFLAEELDVAVTDILDYELNTFIMEEPHYVGIHDTMLSAPRLDNQTSVCALLSAIAESERENGINMIALFDHEEIGNSSKQGAASILLHDMLRRILRNLGAGEERIEQLIYRSMLLSVDVAHGLHPNKAGKMDITNHPVLGKGFCIKEACSQSYATDAEAIAVLCQICDSKHIPYQRFVNRSDVRGGGTLGSVASTLLPIKTVDIGIPLLSMHSARELMGANDIEALMDAVAAFFCE